MYKIIEKIPDNIPENEIQKEYGFHQFVTPHWMKQRNYTRENVFDIAKKSFKYDKDINIIKKNIFKEKDLKKFCSHFIGIVHIGVQVSIVLNFEIVTFSLYFIDKTLLMYDSDNNKYIKVIFS